jgi:hypothetical protein
MGNVFLHFVEIAIYHQIPIGMRVERREEEIR